MQGVARWFLSVSVLFAVAGMALGMRMGLTENHDQIPAHAHMMLVGWVNSALMGFYYHLVPAAGGARLAKVHFAVQSVGAVVMSAGLWLKYAGNAAIAPVIGIGAIAVLGGMLIFAWTVLRQPGR